MDDGGVRVPAKQMPLGYTPPYNIAVNSRNKKESHAALFFVALVFLLSQPYASGRS